MKKISILCLALLCFLVSQSQIRYLQGNLQSSQETPPNNSAGSGVVIVQYNMATKTIKLYGDYMGLTNSITVSHIHRGQPGVAGPVVVDLMNTGGPNGTLSVTATLTQALEDSLLAGNLYANVHTPTNPGGELRAQLMPTTNGKTTFLSGRLQGAQETPPNPSPATGSVYLLVDMVTDSVYVTGNYTGLTTTSTASHIHLAGPSVAGNILITLMHSSATFGTIHGMDKVTAQDAATISSGGSYVNVHTSKYPGGEVRAQLVNNTTMRYLAGDLSGNNAMPANMSKARGTVIVVYDPATMNLQLAGDYQNLSDTVMGAALYMGTPGAPPTDSIPLATSRDSSGTITNAGVKLTPAQDAALLAGTMYVSVRDAKFPKGEIMTTLKPTASGETQLFAVALQGTQEVPPISAAQSAASGNALVILDKTTGMVYATGAFSGINSPVFRADIRRGPAGDTGAVILPLFPSKVIRTKSGTVSGSGALSASLIDSMINGLTYINVYSTFFPTGALRAQLGDLVLPLKLTYFNGYKQRNQVELVWETSEELNVSRYEIEQLNTTTQQWMTKGAVPAIGGSTATTYNFADAPNQYGSTYVLYRLKMIDKDGRTTYSSLVKVNFDKLKAELFILTNPIVNGELKYTITGLSSDKKAEVSVIDYNGRLMLRNTVSSLMNNTLRLSKLSAGMYKLIVRIDDTVLQKSFIK